MTTPEIPDVAVWAAAEAMYSQRPQSSDPKHWETPWNDVPEGWKRGQHRAARQVLEAAAPHIRADERRRVLRALSTACEDYLSIAAIDAIIARLAEEGGEVGRDCAAHNGSLASETN